MGPKTKEAIDILFPRQMEKLGVQVKKEVRFHPERKWRFDWVLPEYRIAIEVEGGVFINGRHSRGVGMEKDMEKYNAATLMGWRVLRYSTRMILRGDALMDLEAHLGEKPEESCQK